MPLPSEAQRLIDQLDLQPHPEGGYFREMFRDKAGCEMRSASTAIYFLLAEGQSSHWHRIDVVEIWHWYKGAPLELSISDGTANGTQTRILGNDFDAAQHPQIVVPAGAWQAARPLGPYTLVGCTVAPGFDFAAFELAPKGWSPTP